MGKNNHLQINILKHILRMHKHDFCGEQSIYTRAILGGTEICMHDFFVWGGGHLGCTENLWGGTCPPPRPPVATPLPLSTPLNTHLPPYNFMVLQMIIATFSSHVVISNLSFDIVIVDLFVFVS